MAFVKRSYLENKARDVALESLVESHIKKIASAAELTVFLSHSHDDADLARGFKNEMASYGIDVYIDWEDSTLPKTPNKETAERIKEKIKQLDVFILLATENALDSKWCPWELGVADSLKGPDDILILPIVKYYDDEFKGNEYLQLYNRVIQRGNGELCVMKPTQRTFCFTTLRQFLQDRTTGGHLKRLLG